jgi:integrase
MKSVANTSQLTLGFDMEAESPAASAHQVNSVPTPAPLARAGRPDADSGAQPAVSQLAAWDFPVLAAAAMKLAALDLHAVETWITARCDDGDPVGADRAPNSATVYRREARRFVLWLRIERGVALAEAKLQDCMAYRAFLADPLPREKWCAPRGTRIGSPMWRPFEGPLCARARRQAIMVLSSMFRFLQDQLYLGGNPWSGVAKPRNSDPRVDPGRSLTREQWRAVEHELLEGPQSARDRQLAWAARFLYSTGLRLSEVAAANCSDLRWVTFEPSGSSGALGVDPPTSRGCWVLRVLGKGLKARDVPVDARVVDELGELLSANGGSNDPRDHADRPLLLRVPLNVEHLHLLPQIRMSGQSLYRQLKQLFSRAAERMVLAGRRHDAAPLLRASTHWLRHTNATHSVDAGVPLDVLSRALGHANLQVTSIYVSAGDLQRRAREAGKLGVSVGRS